MKTSNPEPGLGKKEVEMTRKLSFPRRASACLAMAVVLLGCIAYAATEESEGKKKVNLDFKDAPVTEVVTKLAQQADISLAIQDEMLKDRKVTVQIRNADPEEALQLVCAAARLRWDQVRPGMWLIYPQPTVTVGGAEVPILGAVGAPSSGDTPTVYYRPLDAYIVGEGGSRRIIPRGGTGPAPNVSFEGDKNLVDLSLHDVPLVAAMRALSEVSRVPIVVHESVPKEIKVTVKVYKMPLQEVVSRLVAQAGLTYTVEERPAPEVEEALRERVKKGVMNDLEFERELRAAPRVATIHIVPKPELKVSGTRLAPGVGRAFGEDVVDLRRQIEERAGSSVVGGSATAGASKLLSRFECPKCHRSAMFPDWKFCPYCGAKLPPRDKDRPTSQSP
jgi:hypothetical protein